MITSKIIVPFKFTTRAMGGHLTLLLDSDADAREAERFSRRLFSRVSCWADRLTRHTGTSDLMRLNVDPRSEVPIRPTLANALLGALDSGELTGGLVDVTLLDARLAAEWSPATEWASEHSRPPAGLRGSFEIVCRGRRSAVVRQPWVRIDLSGVGKGLLADRALVLAVAYGSAVVDAGGDSAIRVAPGKAWEIEIGDPRDDTLALVTMRLCA